MLLSPRLAVQNLDTRELIEEQPCDGPHSAAAAMRARCLIAGYAWRWLSSGHLLALVDLQRALALVPCSLPALMQVCAMTDRRQR